MKLNPGQLKSHLSSGVAPVYLVSCDEPLLIDETLDEIRAAARKAGCEERELHVISRGFDWDALHAGSQNMSLFASRRLIELRLPTARPGDKGSRYIVELVNGKPIDHVTVIITPALDSRTARSKWASVLQKKAVYLFLKAPRHEQMPRWIAARLRKMDLQIDDPALEILASRVEGNLLAAKQEIDKLVLIARDGHVTLDTVKESVADGARYDVFQLADAALAGDGARAARILQGLHREGVAPPLVLWSLARDISALADIVARVAAGRSIPRAMREAGVRGFRQKLLGRAAAGHDIASVRRLVAAVAAADRIAKGARRGQTWDALMEVTLALAGNGHMLAETA